MNGSDFETVQDSECHKFSGENFDIEDQGWGFCGESVKNNKSTGINNASNTSFEN